MHKILLLVVALFTGPSIAFAFTDPPVRAKCSRRNRDLRDSYQFHNNVDSACAEQMQKSKDACSADPKVSNDDLNATNEATDGSGDSDSSSDGSDQKAQGASASWKQTAQIHRMKKEKYDGRASLCRDEAEKVRTACANYIDNKGGPRDLLKALNNAADCDGASARDEESEAEHADVIASSISDGSPAPTGPGTEKPDPYQFKNDEEGRGMSQRAVNLEGVSAEDIERAQAAGTDKSASTSLADSESGSKLAEATKTGLEYSKPILGAWGGIGSATISAAQGNFADAGKSLAVTGAEEVATVGTRTAISYTASYFTAETAVEVGTGAAVIAGAPVEAAAAGVVAAGSVIFAPTTLGADDTPYSNHKRAIKLMEP